MLRRVSGFVLKSDGFCGIERSLNATGRQPKRKTPTNLSYRDCVFMGFFSLFVVHKNQTHIPRDDT
ncbi:hypothetical protein TU78_14915 [Pseudomonas taetrolens]|uniref:Uncharacterized protein n=1 Tax=Pseudomonas taetrolens TaxID=47884 RepID=A0A0J6GN33_PSETA|nr:hypothetical protein TU78_14915 [Pseudomonas taetrolens]